MGSLVEKGAIGGTAVNAGFIWTAPSYEVLREVNPDGDRRLPGRSSTGSTPRSSGFARSTSSVFPPSGAALRPRAPDRHDELSADLRGDRPGRSASEVIQPGRTESLLTDEHGAVTGAIVVAPDGGARSARRRPARHRRIPGRSRAPRVDPPEPRHSPLRGRTTTRPATVGDSHRASAVRFEARTPASTATSSQPASPSARTTTTSGSRSTTRSMRCSSTGRDAVSSTRPLATT